MEEVKKIADHYGLSKQQRQLSEECAELIQASSKYMRYKEVSDAQDRIWKYIQNVVEEIADVEIMLEQIKYLMHISDECIQDIKKRKIERQLERIEQEEKIWE